MGKTAKPADRRTLAGKIGAAIEAARGELTRAEAAERSGMTLRQFSFYASGARTPDLDSLVRIARGLRTTVSELVRDLR